MLSKSWQRYKKTDNITTFAENFSTKNYLSLIFLQVSTGFSVVSQKLSVTLHLS